MIFMSGISHFLIYINMIIQIFTSRRYCDAERAKGFCLENLFTLPSSRVPRVETPLDQTSQINTYFLNFTWSPLSGISS